MKEIGGYIELDEAYGEEYHNNAIALNSGRHCLEYLVKSRKISKIYLPDFLCASVRNQCEKCGCEYEIYTVGMDFRPEFDKMIGNHEYLYLVNYYGQITNEEILEYKRMYKNIIVDNAQDFFRFPVRGIDTIYTCRKFFGVSDGGYLYTDNVLEEELPIDYSFERIHYVLGRYEVNAGTFYEESNANNKVFRTEELKQMSKLTHRILRGLPYDEIATKRTENFIYLHEKLKDINQLKISIVQGAYMYPLYVENGVELKKKMIQNKIFVPTLWPDVFEHTQKGANSWKMAENIVPLPVDQRYDKNDMERIIGVINN